MKKKQTRPQFLFEVSWEVCNMVGGIYTVLKTKNRILQSKLSNNILYIGPLLQKDKESLFFMEDETLFKEWKIYFEQAEGLPVKVGYWNIPGQPKAVLVDWTHLFKDKNKLYAEMWEWYKVDSLHGYGDYDEASLFSIAAAKVAQSFYNYYLKASKENVIFHAHEWMCGMGALYIRHEEPAIATMFTTHATTIGRSIAGNGKPLYKYFKNYFGDQMARELNVVAKHSVEKATAHAVDCFTTVSELTARECEQLLEKRVDKVLPNGFDHYEIPKAAEFNKRRTSARKKMLKVARNLTGTSFSEDTFLIGTSGRNEFRNKGLDFFLHTLNRLGGRTDKKVLAFIFVPGWVGNARADLLKRMKSKTSKEMKLADPYYTHTLNNLDEDAIVCTMRSLGLNNSGVDNNNISVIYVPCYLDGNDGIFNEKYYDLLIGLDLSIYPSYYEPWGYTPLESIAYRVPTVTTNLSGFGLWALKQSNYDGFETGVKVIERDDDNFEEALNKTTIDILEFMKNEKADTHRIRRKASDLSKKATWSRFISHYLEAYNLAFQNSKQRK